MSKNVKNKNYKEFLSLRRREDELLEIKKNLGYIELDKPIHHGYNANLTLREDVSRREDAWIFYGILKLYSNVTWSKTTSFYTKIGKRTYSDSRPKISRISEKEYQSLVPAAQKWFVQTIYKEDYLWNGDIRVMYSHQIPEHFLVMNVEKSYITYQKVVDSDVERELAFVQDKMWKLADLNGFWDSYGSGYSKYRKLWNKSERRRNKVALKKNLNTDFINDSVEYHNYMMDIHKEENEYYGNEIHESHFKHMTERDFITESDWTNWSGSSAWSCDFYEFTYRARNSARWMWW